jgi:hypothetical protein
MIYTYLPNPCRHGTVSKCGNCKRFSVGTFSFFTVCLSTLERHLEDAFVLWRGEALDVIVRISAQITPEFQQASSSTCASV